MSGYNFNLLCNCWYTRDSCLVYLCVNRARVSILFLSRTKASARSTSHTTILFLFYIYVIIYIYSFSLFVFIFLSFYLESFHKFIIFLNGNIFNLFDFIRSAPQNNNRRFEFENGRVFCIFWRFFSCFCFCHLLVLSRMEKIILYRVKMVEIGLSKSGKSRAKFWNG